MSANPNEEGEQIRRESISALRRYKAILVALTFSARLKMVSYMYVSHSSPIDVSKS